MSQHEKHYPITDEEWEALRQLAAAASRGDLQGAREHIRKIKLPPRVLLGIKEDHGADYIRERGYNTELADDFYGPGWLDN